ncbi:ribonuclease E/G [Sphingomicrobium sp. XHP0239]|uniref:ribonuclease E/G n=1 Tax=Sphingomicrobium maritimum TaxID=3133972 RepID=UPI0031CC944A
MSDWVIERGIGETRAARLDAAGAVVEARVRRDGVVAAGTVLNARLVAIAPRVTVEAAGEQFLLPRGASGISEGAAIRIRVTREAIGTEPWKRALAVQTDEDVRDAPPLAEGVEGVIHGWEDLLEKARAGIVDFDGGQLRIEPTAAMTMIDVDGWLVPDKLAQMAAWAAARAIARLDLGGSVGVDFPSIEGKAARQEIGTILDDYLPEGTERTQMNGYGFVQIVRAKDRASLVDLATDRAAFEARALLRRAGTAVGATTLAAHPAVVALLETRTDWIEALARRVGGAVTLKADPGLAMSGGYAD